MSTWCDLGRSCKVAGSHIQRIAQFVPALNSQKITFNARSSGFVADAMSPLLSTPLSAGASTVYVYAASCTALGA